MPTITNVICTNNKEIDIQSSGGALKLATAGVATVVTIGNVTGATAVNTNAGTAGSVHTMTNGVFTVVTGTGTVSISGDATNNSVNIATGGGVKLLTLGSTNTSSAVTINTGSAGITVPSFSSYGVVASTNAGLLSDVAAGASGTVLTSAGTGALPTWSAPAAAIGTINGNTGSITGTTVTINGGTTGLTTSGSSATMSLTGTLVVANGGTGVTSVTISPTATAFAGWDANKNLSSNNVLQGYSTTAMTGGSTSSLTVASSYLQMFTGTSTHTLTLPAVSTLVLGQQFLVMNIGTGGSATLTVKTSGANNIALMQPQTQPTLFTCIATSGTGISSWSISSFIYTDYAQNILLGEGAGRILDNTTSSNNICIGRASGVQLSGANGNICIGLNSELGLQTGANNVCIGQSAGVSSTATNNNNTVIGSAAWNNLNGANNVGIGANAFQSCSSTDPNTGVGAFVLNNLGTGGFNTAIGYQAGTSIDGTDASNIFIGYNAAGASGNNHVLQIGAATGTGSGGLQVAKICGITGISAAASANIVMVNSSNQLTTQSSVAVVYPTTNITGTSQTIVPGYIYTVQNASLTTLTLPASAALGTKIVVVGNGAGGWKIAQASGQQINSTATSTTSGATGTLSSGGRYDSVTLCCTVADTTWSIVSFAGTLAFV